MQYHSLLGTLRTEEKLVGMLNNHECGAVTMSDYKYKVVQQKLQEVRDTISVYIISFTRGV